MGGCYIWGEFGWNYTREVGIVHEEEIYMEGLLYIKGSEVTYGGSYSLRSNTHRGSYTWGGIYIWYRYKWRDRHKGKK